jgi:flavin reductase (DIM6/NTAB) family NADH-FMN oxidoreductase RutF
MIDPKLKKVLGQAMHGVQAVGAAHDGVARLYCSHWVMQVSFEEPIVMASMSPKHDTYPLIKQSGVFAVSLLAADQVAEGQYFSYPGRKFRYIANEYVEDWDGLPIVPNAIGYLRCEVFHRQQTAGAAELDHTLVFANVVAVKEGRLKDPPLLYSSRLGWRMAGDTAREKGTSVRDVLLARLGDATGDATANIDDE